MAGRPSSFTPEIAAEICARIAEGRSLRSICTDEDMPPARTVFDWLASRPEFSQQYARAREAQADALAEECLDIADDGTNDWMERQSESEKGAGVNNGWVLNGEHVQRSRLRIDARKWYASKLAPKKYGDKIELEHEVGDGLTELLKAVDGRSGLQVNG